MALFYATIQGNRKPISKSGQSSIHSHTRTWGHGIKVEYRLAPTGTLWLEVWETGGSLNPEPLTRLYRKSLGKPDKRKAGSAHYGKPIGGF